MRVSSVGIGHEPGKNVRCIDNGRGRTRTQLIWKWVRDSHRFKRKRGYRMPWIRSGRGGSAKQNWTYHNEISCYYSKHTNVLKQAKIENMLDREICHRTIRFPLLSFGSTDLHCLPFLSVATKLASFHSSLLIECFDLCRTGLFGLPRGISFIRCSQSR